jgi:TPR repeat protein
MSRFWNVAIPVACVGIAATAISWQVYKAKTTERNLIEKERLCRISADRGEAQGQYCLGSMYYYGQIVPRDYAEALSWYRKAADQGYAKAQYGIGAIYYYGNGVPRDYVEALRWNHMAADQNDAGAQQAIGSAYYYGDGVSQDRSEAVRWYRLAADQGFAAAQYSLGLLYYRGRGVTQDHTEAYRWFHKAADLGNEDAERTLGQWPAGWMNLRFAILISEFLIGTLWLIHCLRSGEGLNSPRPRVAALAGGFLILSAFLNYFSLTHPEIKDIRFVYGALIVAKLVTQATALILAFINFRLAKDIQPATQD